MLNNKFVYIRKNFRQKLRSRTNLVTRRLKIVAGFSLFEFILVLMILSVLTAVLVPKLIELQVDAHTSNVQLTANSFKSAINVIHTLWQSQGSKDQVVVVDGYEEDSKIGLKVLVGPKGWPIDIIYRNASGNTYLPALDLIISNTSTCDRLWNGLLKQSTSDLELNIDKKVGKVVSKGITTFQSEFYQGVCRFKYLLGEDDFRIEYDPITGRVDTFF